MNSPASNENARRGFCPRFALESVLLLHFTLPSGSWSVEGEKKQNKNEKGQTEIQETKHVINI